MKKMKPIETNNILIGIVVLLLVVIGIQLFANNNVLRDKEASLELTKNELARTLSPMKDLEAEKAIRIMEKEKQAAISEDTAQMREKIKANDKAYSLLGDSVEIAEFKIRCKENVVLWKEERVCDDESVYSDYPPINSPL